MDFRCYWYGEREAEIIQRRGLKIKKSKIKYSHSALPCLSASKIGHIFYLRYSYMESAFQGFGLAGLCGKCFRPVSNEVGGYILSCSDFLCSQCASNGIISDCPACGKCRVHLLDLKKELPDEVGGNLMDPIEQLGRVVSNAKFQIKYYKLTIRKLLSKLGQLNRENGQLKRFE